VAKIAASGIRTINTAEVSYFSTYQAGYAAALARLGPGGPTSACPGATVANACLIDGVLSSNGNPAGTGKSGYSYATVGNATTYSAVANPLTVNTTGVRSFCSIEDGVVRFVPTGPLGGACAPTIAPLM